MKHARDDYNERITDSAGLIPEDEPVFLLRGQDVFAPQVLFFYATLVAENNPEISQLCILHAVSMIQWQANNKRKYPDLPYQKGEDTSSISDSVVKVAEDIKMNVSVYNPITKETD